MNDKMTYEVALNWIHSNLAFGIKPGLERMTWMLEQLGNPQQSIKGVHVVGTNGKGSTVNYLQKILTASGYHVGTFTSPYIMDFKERISLDGQMIDKEDFVALVNTVAPVVERLPIETNLEPATEFEVITVLMFYYFGRMHPVDLAIIEAGLGGLYDSTNVFKPLVLACPSIGLDHQAILGHSHVEIAQQKVGALKLGVPLVYASDRDDVREVFEHQARAMSSESFMLGREFVFDEPQDSLTFKLTEKGLTKIGQSTDVSLDLTALTNLVLPMPGHHQLSNASLAVMTSLLLKQDYPQLTSNTIKDGLLRSHWLGRTELLRPRLMIDGAHNNESIAALIDLLRTQYNDEHVHILFAAIDTKPVTDMLKQLEGFASLTVTTFDYPNSLPLAAYPEGYAKTPCFQEWLNTTYRSDEGFYVITGSLYFISQVRQWLL